MPALTFSESISNGPFVDIAVGVSSFCQALFTVLPDTFINGTIFEKEIALTVRCSIFKISFEDVTIFLSDSGLTLGKNVFLPLALLVVSVIVGVFPLAVEFVTFHEAFEVVTVWKINALSCNRFSFVPLTGLFLVCLLVNHHSMPVSLICFECTFEGLAVRRDFYSKTFFLASDKLSSIVWSRFRVKVLAL